MKSARKMAQNNQKAAEAALNHPGCEGVAASHYRAAAAAWRLVSASYAGGSPAAESAAEHCERRANEVEAKAASNA